MTVEHLSITKMKMVVAFSVLQSVIQRENNFLNFIFFHSKLSQNETASLPNQRSAGHTSKSNLLSNNYWVNLPSLPVAGTLQKPDARAVIPKLFIQFLNLI